MICPRYQRLYCLVSSVLVVGLSIQPSAAFSERSAFTTTKDNSGRLGDQLLCYLGAKVFARQHPDLFYLHRKDVACNGLVLDDCENIYTPELDCTFDAVEKIEHNTVFDTHKKILYKLPCGLAFKHTQQLFQDSPPDKDFLEDLKRMIVPKGSIALVAMPKNMVSVAVHVRKGSDTDHCDNALYARFPRKFLPDQFYIDQIRKLADYFSNQQLYVYLFTDMDDVSSLKKQYERALLDRPTVHVACNHDSLYKKKRLRRKSKSNNSYTHTILSDLFSMVKFDCLIRSNSNFSRVAQIIGDHKLVICAAQVHWDKENEVVVVDKTKFAVKDTTWCENMKKIKKE